MINSYKTEKKKLYITIFVLLLLLVVIFFLSICLGRYHTSIGEVFRFVFGREIDDTTYNVISNLRIPRTLVAVMIGGALSLSGVIYQSAFNNKLVSPDLLGVSSGASVGACLAILLGLSSILISAFAFSIGFIAVFLSLLVAKIFKNKSNVILILSGLAVGGLMSSFIGLLKYLADDEMKLAEMTYWLLGDISGVTMNDFWIMFPVVVLGGIITFFLSWRLNIISLGRKESKSLGVNYSVTMIILIIVATSLTAAAVSISGTIGWVGLVIPNVVRMIVGSDNRKVVPISILSGSIFMVIVDILARALAPNEIPLSVITGIIGTPLFIYAIYKKRKELR